ncbi:MAG: hypothetical protein ABSH29_21665 [Acidimicrobiales bacterium]|jgi:hypothetical protein
MNDTICAVSRSGPDPQFEWGTGPDQIRQPLHQVDGVVKGVDEMELADTHMKRYRTA